jgi:hypothetical protein
MCGETQIVIRTAHDYSTTFILHLGAFILGKWNEIRIEPTLHGLFSVRKLRALLENIHNFSFLVD